MIENEESIRYCLMPIKIMEILNNDKSSSLLITSNCEPYISSHNKAKNNLSSVNVFIELMNVCTHSEFDLAIVARNPV